MEDDPERLKKQVQRLERRCEKLEEKFSEMELVIMDLLTRAPLSQPQALSQPTLELAERYLIVRVEHRLLGLPLQLVHEVVRMAAIEDIPNSLDALEGMLNLRGDAIEVLNLRVAFGEERKEDDLDSRMVILEWNKARVAFKVDEVLEVEGIDNARVSAAPEHTHSQYIQAIYHSPQSHLIMLLDIKQFLDSLGLGALIEARSDAAENEAGEDAADGS